jgi:hypothetical protein
MIQELRGQYALNVRGLRIIMTPKVTTRIHLYGTPAYPTPLLGDLILVRDDGTPLTTEELWLDGLEITQNPSPTESGDVNYSPSVSFRVKNDSPRTALGVSVEFAHLQTPADFGYDFLPDTEVRVDSGAWTSTDPNQVRTETIGDLDPGETSSQLFTYRLRLDPVDYFFSSWTVGYAQPLVIRPVVTGWSA